MLWDWTKARTIVQSESIPRAFLSTPAFQLWGLKSYTHFCFLSKIRWGRTLAQRFVTMIYFGLQGFTAVLVSLPRLIVYSSILLAAKNTPDFATSQQGFESMQLSSSFTSLEGLLLKIMLVVMAASTVIRGLHLVRILGAGLVCTFSLCFLGRMRKAMTRDLESRITSLVGSTSFCGRNGSQTSHGGMSTKHDLKMLSQDEQQQQQRSMSDNAFQLNSSISVSFVSEKSADHQSTPQLDHNSRSSQDVFYQIDLEQHSHPQAAMDSPAERPLTPGFNLYPPSSDAVPLVTLSLSERNHHTQPVYSQPHQPVQPIMTTSTTTKGPYLTAPHNSSYSIHSQQQTGASDEDTAQRKTIDHLAPNNRLAALSFYDDLLKSINSERMIYAHRAMVDVRQNIQGQETGAGRQSHNASLTSPSIALCSSIPLTYSSGSEYDDRHSSERPVHPFDTAPCQSRFPTPGTDQDITGAITDIYMLPMDLMDMNEGLEINLQSQPGSQESLHAANFRDLRRASRCGSSHSQETIENWRIHVAPSSPVIPEIDFDMQDTRQRRESTTPTPTGGGYDEYNSRDLETGADSRRGTIPIILSSHLQEAAVMYQEDDDQDNYNIADDLHVPRPFYAYGQGRSQRQGSIQSSVGGYNYSTAASSPSLADSLSNPMYQQQVHGIMSATGFPRSFPPRKGSLPCSVSSSVLDDITTPRGPQFVHQQPSAQSQISYLSANTALPVRTRPRAPSHLSNMVNHIDGSIANTETTHTAGSNSFLPKRGHIRSHSQGSRTTESRGSPWDQLGAFKETQAGYTTLIDIPATTCSQMSYRVEDDDDDFMLHESVRMSIKAGMSLKEALAIDNLMYRNSLQQPQQTQHVLAPSFNGDIDDKMVHPLDLSPLLLQTPSGPQYQQTYGYPARLSPATRSADSPAAAQLAWDETCVGLGLTMTTAPSQYQAPQQNNNHQASIEDFPLPQRPIPVRYHQLDRSDSNTSYQQQQRPDMASISTTSDLTTHTLQSDATLNSGSYATSSAITTTNTFVDIPFTNSNFSSHPSMSSFSLQTQQRINNDYEQDTTDTPYHHHHHYYQYSHQQQRHHQDQRQYSFSQRSDGEPQDFQFPRSRDYNNNHHYQQQQPVQRQPSQRNKKNLVVNISPPSQQMY
ncbi:hypothetical protein BGZ95_006390 [Linnemannia exigua]|uniref:Uncharacterized protein n=1 Tax=Linnemannia exigua TaxID=604196 RepID=A0AAD4DG52_9FUNG|nr:hypothetical protein BGZ95_006390 [Linnemannia exigua]